MRRSKKFILIGVLVAIALVGSLAGIALAQTNADGAASGKTLLGRVSTILGIDQQKLENAFTQAQQEMREEALDNHLKNLVEQGTITQEQSDQYKAWLKSKPDITPFQEQLREWQKARPDIPIPDGFNGRGFRGPRGFGGSGFPMPGSPTDVLGPPLIPPG